MHHLVEAEASPARSGPPLDDELPEKLVEKIVAADDGLRREVARNRGAGERRRQGVREGPHVVEALPRVAELPAK